jgi:hypothetical protein
LLPKTSIYTCGASQDFRTRTLRRHLDSTISAALESAWEAGMKVGHTWRLCEVMAAHGVFTATELVPLLRERGIDLSASPIHRLVSGTPERLSAGHGRTLRHPVLHPNRPGGHHRRSVGAFGAFAVRVRGGGDGLGHRLVSRRLRQRARR